MALTYTFANLTTAQGSYLDTNFAEVGALGTIPCTVSGTNTIVMSPQANTPTISAYANYLRFSGIVAATNTGTVTVNVSGIGALNGYKDTAAGPVALSAGDLFVGNSFVVIYDSALNSGAGGFHVTALPTAGSGTVTSVATGTGLTGGPITTTGTLSLDTATNLTIKSNISGSTAAPVDNSLSAIFDAVVGSTRGTLIARDGTAWEALAKGNQFQFLYAGSNDLAWGISKTLGIAAAGSDQASATALTTMFNEVTSVPASTGVIMANPTTSGTGGVFAIFNRGGLTLNVYPPVGAAIDGNAANAAVTIAAGSKNTFVGVSDTQFYTWC